MFIPAIEYQRSSMLPVFQPFFVAFFLTFFLAAANLPAQASTPGLEGSSSTPDKPTMSKESGTVRVGVRTVPPFVVRDEQGEYSGLTIALWEHIASDLGLDYELVEHDLQGLIDGVSGSDLFAAASALTITAEREEILDFTHPFFVSGLGIAVTYRPVGFWQAVAAFFSVEFLWIILLLSLLLLFWGVLVWYFERRVNPEEFGGSAAEGIGSGFWWAAVTMTTVGYGDKSPRSLPGRLIGLVWMFSGIILVSFFTASIASSLTVSQLDSRVAGPQDLPFVRVGVLRHSATEDYMTHHRIRYQSFASISDGLQAVADDEIDAFVHDAPILRYYATQDYTRKVRVLPGSFNEQYYGIALPLNSPWRNEINRVILDYIASEEWEALNRRYLGR